MSVMAVDRLSVSSDGILACEMFRTKCWRLAGLIARSKRLCNLTHASRALTGVAGRWQAGVGEVPRILLDEIQARAPPGAIVHVSQAG